MQIVITDPAQVAAFSDPKQFIEFVDVRGNVVGHYMPPGYGAPPGGVLPPTRTPEGLEALRKGPFTGRSAAQIINELERVHGEGA